VLGKAELPAAVARVYPAKVREPYQLLTGVELSVNIFTRGTPEKKAQSFAAEKKLSEK
jgi:hypothetical protein